MAQKILDHSSVFLYSKDFFTYKLGKNHPFNPFRIELTYDLLKCMGALNEGDIVKPHLASEESLLLGHSQAYINIVKSLESNPNYSIEQLNNYGLATEDTPIFDNIHKAGLSIVGATLCAITQVVEGKSKHALNLAGGLHHGLYGQASGFCIYNDIVIGIKHLVENYGKRVLYVDTDAHHGDGVQWAFYDDPRVCTLSIHETGRFLFPGTGAVHERGSDKGYGFTFNIPMDAFTEDESWINSYKESFEKVIDYFKPDIIITQNGVDAHHDDPLTHLCLTMKAFHFVPKLAHTLAHKYCGGRWVALGGGGYNIFKVVPRAWALLWLEMMDNSQDLEYLPKEWIDKWQEYTEDTLPKAWADQEDLFTPIPRREEINEKNKMTVKKALYSISKEQFGNNFFRR